MKITILYDNEALEGFNSGWAFSCLVEAHGKKVLFDTGSDSHRLIQNMQKLGVALREIDAIFISHDHPDHASGLAYLLNLTGSIPVFVPCSFSKCLKEEISKIAKLFEIKDAAEIMEGFYSTGELGSEIKEQSLVVKTEKGNVVVCGCSHPGVELILEKAGGYGQVYGIVGGFHGFSNLDALKNLKLISPCHCTRRKNEIIECFPNTSKKCGSGMVFEV